MVYHLPNSSPLHSPQSNPISPKKLLDFLEDIATDLKDFYIEEGITKQIFSHLVHYINATAFNTLLLRKDLCTSRRGMQIQYNVSQVEQWLIENGFSEGFV